MRVIQLKCGQTNILVSVDENASYGEAIDVAAGDLLKIIDKYETGQAKDINTGERIPVAAGYSGGYLPKQESQDQCCDQCKRDSKRFSAAGRFLTRYYEQKN